MDNNIDINQTNNYIFNTNSVRVTEGDNVELDSIPVNGENAYTDEMKAYMNEEKRKETIINSNFYHSLSEEQSELEKTLSENIKQIIKVASVNNRQLSAFQEKMATQVNPKVFTNENILFAQYITQVSTLLNDPISKQSILAKVKKDLLGLSISTREQGYIDYNEVLSFAGLEKIPEIASMIYTEFSTNNFGQYAKQVIEQRKIDEEKGPIGRSIK